MQVVFFFNQSLSRGILINYDGILFYIFKSLSGGLFIVMEMVICFRCINFLSSGGGIIYVNE